MFERFTDRARRVVVSAQDEARPLDHNFIGTEHLLLGIIRDDDSVADTVLGQRGVTLDAARTEVSEIVGRGRSAPSGHIPFTPRAKEVLELAWREASQRGDSRIGTEHLLLGLLREGEGVAVQVLDRLRVDRTELRQAVLDAMPEARHADETKGSRRRFGPFRRRSE